MKSLFVRITIVLELILLGSACTAGNMSTDMKSTEQNAVPKIAEQKTPADKQAAIDTLTQARELFAQAVAAQGGWGSTKKLLKNAEVSVAKGDYDKALALAEKAKRQASLRYTQAKSELTNWSEPEFLQ